MLERIASGQEGRCHTRTLHFKGVLDSAALRLSLREVVTRHSALRTTIVTIKGQPRQSIGRKCPLRIEVVDLRKEPDPEIAAIRHELARSRTRLEMAEEPPWRVEVLRLRDDAYIVLLLIHPIIGDARSARLILRELAASYTARCRREASPLTVFPPQFVDYAYRQRRRLRGTELERLLNYWRRQLAGAPPRLILQGHGAGTAPRSRASELLEFALPARTAKNLAALIGATLDVTLLASFLVLLHRYSGSNDLVVGITDEALTNGAHESVVGPLTNLLPLRIRLEPAKRFASLVSRVATSMNEARCHAELPFACIVDELRPGRSLNHEPVVQVTFALHRDPNRVLSHIEDLTAAPQSLTRRTMDLDLEVSVLTTGDSLVVALEYRTDVYRKSFVTRLARSWHLLLEYLAASSDVAIDTIPLTSEEDQHALQGWNNTAVEFGDATVVDLFEEAARDSLRPAVLGGEGKLTYGELDDRSNRLAARLKAEGVGPESLVAVKLERSFDLVVALLAIFKAGGAYLPIDPAWPQERVAFILDDARPSFVLSRTWLERSFAASPTRMERPSPSQLAYVIYTSGSTGKPKGVMIEHGALANQLQWLRRSFPLEPSDRVPFKYSFTFDASIWEIFGTLVSGAQLILVEPGYERDLDYLIALFADYRVTVLDVVPAFLDALIRHPGFARLVALRRVTCGGEQLSVDTAQRFAAVSDAELYNLYGPTEATITSSAHKCCEQDVRNGAIPLGRPAANTTIHLLEEDLRPTPLGAVGEIYIGGAQVARGYLGRLALTREKFVNDPLQRHGRLFRSGDLGRWCDNGTLEFVGRRDLQVKIRGYRVELEEVEAAIAKQPQVLRCAVALEPLAKSKVLSAYLVPTPGDAALCAHELRAALRGKLPEYMIPGRFFLVPSLPLTGEGKVDRTALGSCAGKRLTDKVIKPRSNMERRLAELWWELLDCRDVGVRSSFFDDGGNSLLAVTLVRRIVDEFGIAAELRDVFEAPTIEQLAMRLEESVSSRRSTVLPPIQGGRAPVQAFALSPIQEQRLRGVSLRASEPSHHVYLAVWFDGPLDAAMMCWALRELVGRHTALRTRLLEDGDRRSQFVEREVDVRLRLANLPDCGHNGHGLALSDLARAEVCTPFDLRRAPILRATLVHVSDDAHAVILVTHSAIADLPSLSVLLRDLSRFYFHKVEGCELPSPIALTYADFARWQRQLLRSGVLAEQAAYWNRKLAGASQVAGAQQAWQRPASALSASGSFSIPKQVSASLLALARRSGTGLFIPLLAAFQALIGCTYGSMDVVVSVPITGRQGLPEIEPLVGAFDGYLPLRTNFCESCSFEEVVRRLRDTVYEARANQEVLLVDPSYGDRVGVGRIVFAFDVEQPFRPGTVALRPVAVDIPEAPYDLELRLTESADSLTGSLRGRANLFEREEIDRMAWAYVRLLAAVAAHPDRPASQLWRVERENRYPAEPCEGFGQPALGVRVPNAAT